ncbi:MAG: alpha/beta hydrolase [Cycloclasticus sp.]|nr:MAG: alpha/beta hydrolase [Cycloclasticus sp.]
MHGLFGSARNWRGIAQKLSKNAVVYTVDLRNHGASPHVKQMPYSLMAEDIVHFMQQQNFQSAQVLGHSMGGKVAMQLALNYPERVNRLIVVDMAPVTYTHNFNDILTALSNIPMETISSRNDADEILKKSIDVLSLRQFLLQNLVAKESGGYAWRVNLDSIKSNMSNIMGFPKENKNVTYTNPTLFIGGGNSTYLAERYLAAVKTLFPSAQVDILKGVGHWPQVEAPKAFLSCLEPFLGVD